MRKAIREHLIFGTGLFQANPIHFTEIAGGSARTAEDLSSRIKAQFRFGTKGYKAVMPEHNAQP